MIKSIEYKKIKYNKFIVVDKDNRPMSFNEKQFYYCTDNDRRRSVAIVIYTKKEAEKLIFKSHAFRIENNFELMEYKLMPIVNK